MINRIIVMSFQDFQRFSIHRELFPRNDNYSSNRLICGHLNRLKFPPNIATYIQARKNGVSKPRAMAKANRCFCRRDDAGDKEEEYNGAERKKVIEKMETLEIGYNHKED